MPAKKFYLTTPIYYVNARPHIGHAYTTIVADVLARRHRLLGDDTFFLTGTDEHGQKIERSATAAGIAPQQFADQVSASFEALWQRMGITNDQFIRTTDEKHIRGAQKLFAELYERGEIYLSSYTGQYSIGEEMFVEGPPGTIGPDGKPTETVTEENFFFRLSEYQERLIDLIVSGELSITPFASRNEVLSFLCGDYSHLMREYFALHPDELNEIPSNTANATEWYLSSGLLRRSKEGMLYVPGALRDLSVSRSSFTWGIPVPEPAASESKQKHVIYVWLDALANYMTAIGYGSDSAADEVQFKKYWPADLHLVGKEITRFHCVYWPAFLMAADLPLPKQITANGWLLFDNAKMSKSRGNIVRTETILEAFGEHVYGKQFPESTKKERDLFASDVLRYFLLREVPFGQDGSFSFDAMVSRYNADLANGYGNLASRTFSMIAQYCSAELPAHLEWAEKGIAIVGVDNGRKRLQRLQAVADTELAPLATVVVHFEHEATLNCRFSLAIETKQLLQDLSDSKDIERSGRGALDYITLLMTKTDQFLSASAPWKLAKSGLTDDREKLEDILFQAAEAIRIATSLLYPYIPSATAKVWSQLGLGDIEEAARNGELNNLEWGGLKPGTKLSPLAPIFPRAEKGLAQIMIDMEDSASTPSATPVSSTDPGAPPRTSSLDEPSGTLTVGGSVAHTTGPDGTPSHKEAHASSPFASEASRTPITAVSEPAAEQQAAPEAAPQITIDDFAKVELRVAQILVAERIPKADKLLRLEVDLGTEKRQILSGIAEWYTPEELVGRRIVVITNLAPRKMRGLESHGMLLAASNGENGKPVLATFGEEIALGSRLK